MVSKIVVVLASAGLATLVARVYADAGVVKHHSVIFMLKDDCVKGSPCQEAVQEKLSTLCKQVRMKPILRMATASCPGSDATVSGNDVVAAIPDIASYEEDFEIRMEV